MPSSYQPRVVLFVDICGSTQLYDTLGDAIAAKNIANCLRALGERVEEGGGRVIQRVGDELMCLFETGEAALNSARIMQEWVTRQEALGQSTIAVRVGCHFGPVIIENSEDLFGDSVNVAARVAAMAKAGQVLTTEDTVATLSGPLRDSIRVLGRFAIRGKREDLTLYELLWQEGDYTFLGTQSDAGPRSTRMILKHAGREIQLGGGERTSLIVGRDAACDIVITDSKASRRHARIETRRDRFVLIDQSANGTYVRIGNEEFPLLREELILYAQGQISFGRRSAAPDQNLVEFVCEAGIKEAP